MESKFSKEIKVVFMENNIVSEDVNVQSKVMEILELNNNSFLPSLYERIEFVGDLKEKIRFRVQDRLKSEYNYILAYIDEEIVGFTEVKFEYREFNGKILYTIAIGTSVVNPHYQNMGVGKALYSKVEELPVLCGAEAVTRSTWSKNLRQLNLYSKFGYIEYERDPNARGIGNDLVKFYKIF